MQVELKTLDASYKGTVQRLIRETSGEDSMVSYNISASYTYEDKRFAPQVIVESDSPAYNVFGVVQLIPAPQSIEDVVDLHFIGSFNCADAYIADVLLFPQLRNTMNYFAVLRMLYQHVASLSRPTPKLLFIRCLKSDEMLSASCEAFGCVKLDTKRFRLRNRVVWFMLFTELAHYIEHPADRGIGLGKSNLPPYGVRDMLRTVGYWGGPTTFAQRTVGWLKGNTTIYDNFFIACEGDNVFGAASIEKTDAVTIRRCKLEHKKTSYIVNYLRMKDLGTRYGEFIAALLECIIARHGRQEYVAFDVLQANEDDKAALIALGVQHIAYGYYVLDLLAYNRLHPETEPTAPVNHLSKGATAKLLGTSSKVKGFRLT